MCAVPECSLHGCAGLVQVALAKESVLWKRGWYTFPLVSAPSHPVVLIPFFRPGKCIQPGDTALSV